MTGLAKKRLVVAALLLLAAAGFLAALLSGPVETSLRELADFLLGRGGDKATIFRDLRLTRALLAFVVGAALSLAGAILQGYFRNPMADPFIVGVSSGASLGAVGALALGFDIVLVGFSGQGLAAFVCGLGIVSLVYFVSQRRGVFRLESLLLTGVAAGAMASALTSFLLFLRADSYEQAVFWLLGSFAMADWRQVGTVVPYLVAGLAGAQFLAKDMNLLALGDEAAEALGCPVRRVRLAFLVIATMLAATAVSVSGIIGFVGLIVPHAVRLLIGPDHRSLFGVSALGGGVFLLFSDLLARSVLPATELPVGVITAAVGAPFFIYLLNQRR